MVFSKGVLPLVSRFLDARADLSGTFYENFEMTFAKHSDTSLRTRRYSVRLPRLLG
jgi:hypothetical protein